MKTPAISFLLLISCWLMLSTASFAQRPDFHIQRSFRPAAPFFVNDTTPNLKRVKLVGGIAGGGYVLATAYLGTVWYANQPLSDFHFFDDSREWQQMDKAGHALGGYTASRWMTDLFKWSGIPKRRAIWLGSASGFMVMNTIEVFDGFGEGWGFSWSDVGANAVGASLSALNYGLWHEERLQLKFSYLPSPYVGTDNPDFRRLFGTNPAEWLVKDYNGQVIWMSARVHSFLPEGNFKDRYPRWLNVAVGYGAQGLEGGYHDPLSGWQAREYRQWYFSLDIDPSHIRTRYGWLNAALRVVNLIRIPLPSLEMDRNGVRVLPLR
ncbi:MAG: DUF2279 domain-containing protein [Bacteroidota bacterium]